MNKDIVQEIENRTSGAERVWLERFGEIVQDKKNWRKVALISIVVNALAIGGLVYLGGKSEFIPYIVEVDKLGIPLAVSVADQTSPIDRRYIVAQLSSFITNCRGVSADVLVSRDRLEKCYAMLAEGSQARRYVVEYFQLGDNANLPYNRARNVMVVPEVNTVIPLGNSNNTWEIVWTDRVTNRTSGEAYQPVTLRANIEVVFESVSNVSDIQINPTGLKIRTLSWSEVMI